MKYFYSNLTKNYAQMTSLYEWVPANAKIQTAEVTDRSVLFPTLSSYQCDGMSSLSHHYSFFLPILNIIQANIKMAEDKLGHDLFD